MHSLVGETFFCQRDGVISHGEDMSLQLRELVIVVGV